MHWQLLTVVLVVAAPAPAEKKDEEKIQGTWVIVSGEHAGKKVPDEEGKGIKFIIKGDVIKYVYPNGEEKATIKLDQEKKPKTFDITGESPDGKDKTQLFGIYELKDDELRMCYAKEVGKRPTEFATKADTDAILVVLKREKKDK